MLLLLLISVCLGFNFNLKERRDNNIAQVKTIINNDTIQIVMGYFQSGNSILNEHNYTYNDSSNDIRGTLTIDEREYFIFKCSDSAGNFPNTNIFYVNGSKIILLSNFLSQFIVKEENTSIYDFVDSDPLDVNYTSTQKNFFVAFQDGTIMTITEEPGSKYESFTYNFNGTFTYKFGLLYTKVYGHGDTFHDKIIDYVV